MKFGSMALSKAGALALSVPMAFGSGCLHDEGDRWRVKERIEYQPELKLGSTPMTEVERE